MRSDRHKVENVVEEPVKKAPKLSKGPIIAIAVVAVLVLALILLLVVVKPFGGTVKVTFDPNGGTMAVTEVEIPKGQMVSEPEEPVKDGAMFEAWLLNGEAFDFTTPVKKKIKLVASYVDRIPVTDAKFELESYKIEVGESAHIKYTLTPTDGNDPVEISSRNNAIASVSNAGNAFILTGVKGGKTEIVLKVNDVEKTAQVEVIPVVEQVTIDKATLEVGIGEKLPLIAMALPTDAPDKTLTWSSADDTIATVDQKGNVTGVKEGNVQITVSSNNGKTAVCDVKVVVIEVTGITLEKTAVDIEKGKTLTITPVIAPANASDKTVTYTSADEKIAKVDSKGKITAVAAGTTEITVASANGVSTVLTVNVLVYPTSILFANSVYYVDVNGTVQTELKFSPEDCNVKNVTYKLANSLAKTDQNGLVTGVEYSSSFGTLEATAVKADGKTCYANAQIAVNGGQVTSSNLAKDTLYPSPNGSFDTNKLSITGVKLNYRNGTYNPTITDLPTGACKIEFSSDDKTFSTYHEYVTQEANTNNIVLQKTPAKRWKLYYRLVYTKDGVKYYSSSKSFYIEPLLKVTLQPATGVTCTKDSSHTDVDWYNFNGNGNDSGEVKLVLPSGLGAASLTPTGNITIKEATKNSDGHITQAILVVTCYNHSGGNVSAPSLMVTTPGGQSLKIQFNPVG